MSEYHPEKPEGRFWTYKRGNWLALRPIYFGADEWCRRTVVIGNRWTGCIVIAMWRAYDPWCVHCAERARLRADR